MEIYSIGVRVISGEQEWSKAINWELNELEPLTDDWDSKIISNSPYLVEEFIDGEEFACDGFWNSNGEVIITCIYRHPFASQTDVRDLVYYTSRQLMLEMLASTTSLLEKIGAKLSLRRFPFHLELKKSTKGTLIPIELNPLRFGGIALADLPEYAFGFNPYELFFTDEAPDWETLLVDENNSHTYVLVIGNVLPHYEAGKYLIDHKGFRSIFGNTLLNYLPSNSKVTTVFGVTYIRVDKFEDALAYLELDFDSFLRPHSSELVS